MGSGPGVCRYNPHLHRYADGPGASAVPAQIQGEIVARNQTPVLPPDHHTRVEWNTTATLVDDSTWDGQTRHAFSGTVPQATLREGENSLIVNYLVQPALGTLDQYFDWFDVTYDRRFVAACEPTYISGRACRHLAISTQRICHAEILAWDITAPQAPRLINGARPTTAGGLRHHLRSPSTRQALASSQ